LWNTHTDRNPSHTVITPHPHHPPTHPPHVLHSYFFYYFVYLLLCRFPLVRLLSSLQIINHGAFSMLCVCVWLCFTHSIKFPSKFQASQETVKYPLKSSWNARHSTNSCHTSYTQGSSAITLVCVWCVCVCVCVCVLVFHTALEH
jgi:hypothetical protein